MLDLGVKLNGHAPEGYAHNIIHGRVRFVEYCSLNDRRTDLIPAFFFFLSSRTVAYVSGRRKSIAT